MKRRVEGLRQAGQSAECDFPGGLFLVRVQQAQYRWQARKPFYLVRFVVLGPSAFSGRAFSGRVYCTPKALWKLTWFLRDFGYDTDSLSHDEIDDKNLIGLRGVVKVSHTILNGATLLNLDGFAPASQWEDLPNTSLGKTSGPEAA